MHQMAQSVKKRGAVTPVHRKLGINHRLLRLYVSCGLRVNVTNGRASHRSITYFFNQCVLPSVYPARCQELELQERTRRPTSAIMTMTKQHVLGGVDKKINPKETLAMLLWGRNQGAELVAEGTHFKQGGQKSSLWGGYSARGQKCFTTFHSSEGFRPWHCFRQKMTSSPPTLPLSLWRNEVGTGKLPPPGNLILNDLSG